MVKNMLKSDTQVNLLLNNYNNYFKDKTILSPKIKFKLYGFKLTGNKNQRKLPKKKRFPKIPDFAHATITKENKDSSTGIHLFSKAEFEIFYSDNGLTYNKYLNKINSLRIKRNISFSKAYSILLYKGFDTDQKRDLGSKTEYSKDNDIQRNKHRNVQSNFINIQNINLDKLLDNFDECLNSDKKYKERKLGLRE